MMKKLFTTLTLAGAVVFGANAQTNVDAEILYDGFINLAGSDVVTDLNCEEAPQVRLVYAIVNHGPDPILPGDVIVIQDPTNETETAAYGFTIPASMTINVNDTVLIQDDTLNYDDIKMLFTIEGSTATANFPEFASGTYVSAVTLDRIDRGSGTLTDANMENNIAGAEVNIDCNLGIFNPSLSKNNLVVYPNPTTNSLSFEYTFNNYSQVADAKVMDITGRIVMSKEFGSKSSGQQHFNISVADLPNGNYTLEFVTDQNRGVSKFTISK